MHPLMRWTRALIVTSVVAVLVGCGTTRRAPVSEQARPYPAARAPADAPRASGSLAGTPGTPSPQQSYRSRWVAVSWNDVPGWQDDQLQDAWNGPCLPRCAKMCVNSCWAVMTTAVCG
jgi:membrane-bound lytic murein transglycosylase A